ncbi:MAG TPA: PEP-CTERM sorting domain-containing protein [Chthoniobacterales bacterium]|jgi:hypothetical protein|nr:PEP-CTERM sorting domain-containing protein [Chthoniobacterales bacterium]
MKKFLLASVFTLAVGPAMADAINLTATVDGVPVASAASPDGSLNINDQAFGAIFNLNSLNINSAEFLAPPGLLSTNTLDVDQTTGGTHTLVIDIKASGLTGPGSLENFLSSFSVSGQSGGWTSMEQTLINGSVLATTPLFAGVSDSASSINAAFATNPFTAEAIYTINTNGIGSFNGGVDISAAVPEPATWGLMLLGFVGLAFVQRRRKVSLA